jgi:hypothetical protein
MDHEAQTYFNIAVAIFSGLGGWILNSLRDSIKSLHESDTTLASKVQSIEVLVAGNYTTNNEMEKITNALFHKLDKIENKLDAKVDRNSCIHLHGGSK